MWFYYLVLGLLVFRVCVMTFSLLFLSWDLEVFGDLAANTAFLIAIWKLFIFYKSNKYMKGG